MRKYDEPRSGYKRHTIFINVELLGLIKRVARKEGVSLKALIEQALIKHISKTTN